MDNIPAFTSVVPVSSGKRRATNSSAKDRRNDQSGSAKPSITVAPLRPKSAGVLSTASRNHLRIQQHKNDEGEAERAFSPTSRVLKPTLIGARVGTKQEDYFCNNFKSPRPRPPSASALVLASARPPRSIQKAEPTTRVDNNSSEASQMREHPGCKSTPTKMTRVGCISQRVMKEEIETQRQLTRQAQKQLHVLHQTLSEKNKEIELVRRHLRAFENSAYCTTGSSPRATSPLPVDSPRAGQPTEGSVISSSTAAVLAAGVQTGGTGARHRESIAAAATMIHNQGGPPSTAATGVARLKDQIQRQELYRKKLKQMLERLCRQLQFIQANLELLQHKQESTRKESAFFQSRLAQERNHCLDLEHKKHELLEKQSSHAHNAMLVLDSLREEIASRTIMTQQRHEADRRRQDLLTLVAASPSLARTMSIDKGLGAGDGSIKSSRSQKNSLHMLSVDKINGDFASTHSSSDLATNRPHGSSRHRANSIDLHHQAHHREAFMQVYEGQYARVLEETRESDLSVVLERFTSFQETKRHLLQIESDVAQRLDQLESEKEAHNDLVRKLRVSGLAEVEKRKKIRDFLEQLHHVKAVVKSQAKDKFVEQLKTLSFVQQGISNIVELLKCLDGRVPLPPLVLTSPLDASSLEAASQGLLAMVHFCVQVVRHNPGAPIVFTAAQAETLRAFVSDHLEPKWRRAIPRPSSPTRGHWMTETSPAAAGAASPMKQPHYGAKAADLAVAQSLVSTLVNARGRRSSAETLAKRRIGASPHKEDTGARSKPAEQVVKQQTRFQEEIAATTTATEVKEENTDGDDDLDALSSESDTENARRDVKRNEKDTLQQVDALLKTLDAKQRMLSQDLALAKGKPLLPPRSGHTGSLHLVSMSELNESLGAGEQVGAAAVIDNRERLEAVHAFFREKKRHERQEQQQQREMLAFLSHSSHSRDTGSGGRTNHSTTNKTGANSGSSAAAKSALASMMTTRKRSNGGIVAFPFNNAIQQQQQQFAGIAVVATAAARKPSRPKTTDPQ